MEMSDNDLEGSEKQNLFKEENTLFMENNQQIYEEIVQQDHEKDRHLRQQEAMRNDDLQQTGPFGVKEVLF